MSASQVLFVSESSDDALGVTFIQPTKLLTSCDDRQASYRRDAATDRAGSVGDKFVEATGTLLHRGRLFASGTAAMRNDSQMLTNERGEIR
jgi:hypothetical protein